MSRSQIEIARRVKLLCSELEGAIFWRNIWKEYIKSGDAKRLSEYRETMRRYARRYRQVLASL